MKHLKRIIASVLACVLIVSVMTPANAAKAGSIADKANGVWVWEKFCKISLTTEYVKLGTVKFRDSSKDGCSIKIAGASTSSRDIIKFFTLGIYPGTSDNAILKDVTFKIKAIDGTWSGTYTFNQSDYIWFGSDHPDGYYLYAKCDAYVGTYVALEDGDNLDWYFNI